MQTYTGRKVRAGKSGQENLRPYTKPRPTINHGFSTLLPALPPDLSLVISCTYSPKRTTTRAKHTKRSSSEINHGSQSGYFWGWCSGFFISGGTKSDGNTPNKTPQSTMGPSVLGPHTKDELLKRISFLMWKLQGLREGQTGTEQGMSVVSGEKSDSVSVLPAQPVS